MTKSEGVPRYRDGLTSTSTPSMNTTRFSTRLHVFTYPCGPMAQLLYTPIIHN